MIGSMVWSNDLLVRMMMEWLARCMIKIIGTVCFGMLIGIVVMISWHVVLMIG